ncbi:MAG: autotransporter-associated beta strand repeat-containing protein, partial [Luteolibacter sp.]|uniref:beta strand repeat-containing protein n=1 Tax=Luteolibacter sp. TaxID=1962973 RepID=UPI003267EF75
MKARHFALFATIAASAPLFAGTYAWKGTTSGDWGVNTNWSATPTFNNAAVLNFDAATPITNYVTFLGSTGRSVKTINVTGALTSPLEIRTSQNNATGRKITFASDSGPATININASVTQAVTIGQGTQVDNVGTITLASDLVVNHSGSGLLTLSRTIDGPQSIAKSGSGTLLISGVNTNLTGDVTISGGILQIGDAASLGATSGDTYVLSGGTLAMNNKKLAAGETVSIAGTGQGGIGALYQSNGNDSGANSITDGLILTGDASIGCPTGIRYGVGSNGAATTGLFTLTKVGAGQFDLRGVVTVGEIVVNGGVLQTQGTISYNTGYNLTVNTGAEFRSFEVGTSFQRNIVLNSGTLSTTGTVDFTGDTYSGNVTLTGVNNVSVTGGATDLLTLSGNIGEAAAGASITVSGSRPVVLGGTNTYTGATTVSSGILNATGSFTSNFTVAAGATLGGEGVTTGTATFANGANFSFDPGTTGTNQFFRAADVTVASGAVVNVSQTASSAATNTVVLRDGNGGLDLSNFTLVNPGRGTLALGGAGGNSDLLYSANAANLEWRGFVTEYWTANDVDLNFQNLGTASPDKFLANDNVSFANAAVGNLYLGSDIAAGNIVFNNTTGNDVSIFSSSTQTITAASITQAGSATNTVSAPVVGTTPVVVNAGTLVLDAVNTSVGTITINSGTLQIGGTGFSGSVATPSIVNNSSLKLNRSDTLTIGSIISGSGTLTKIGLGTITLTGANTYAGLTTVSEGTLQIGTGTTGSITGNIENNANLQLVRSDSTTFANTVTGTGTLTKSGTGILTLSGANSFSGGLILVNGTLIAGSANISSGPFTFAANANATVWQLTGNSNNDINFPDGATGNKVINLATGVTDLTLSGTITISDNATTFNTFSTSRLNPIGGTIVITGKMTGTGSGGIAKRNTGTVVITNTTNDYTGPTNIVDAGTLIVNGKVPGDLSFGENVDGSGGPAGTSTGFLAGSGTVMGNVKLQGGSHIAPGGTSSAGVTTPTAAVLTIGGNLNLSVAAAGTGGIVMDLVAPAGTSDRIAVGGTVDIGTNVFGLADVSINNLGGLAAGSYTLITSAGITGTVDPA